MDTPQSQRDRVITLHQDAKLSIRSISSKTKIPRSTVGDIIKRFTTTGSSSSARRGRCGRRRLSSLQHDRMILRTSMKNPRLTAVDIKKEVSSHLSVHSVRRRLNEGGRFVSKPIRKPLLTAKMRHARLAWARAHKDWTAEQWQKVSYFS